MIGSIFLIFAFEHYLCFAHDIYEDLLLELISGGINEYEGVTFAYDVQLPPEGLQLFSQEFQHLFPNGVDSSIFDVQSIKEFPKFGKCQLSTFDFICSINQEHVHINTYINDLIVQLPKITQMLPAPISLGRFDLF